MAFLFHGTGLNSGAVDEFIAASALTKTTLPALNLILRGIFCNIPVCLGVWCNAKMKSESGKLIMIFWCLFAFITIGNMLGGIVCVALPYLQIAKEK